MALPIDEELHYEMSLMVLQYKKICDFFGFSDEQRKSSHAAGWMIEAIKQYQTSYNVMKTIRMNNDKTDSLAGKPVEATMPPLPNNSALDNTK